MGCTKEEIVFKYFPEFDEIKQEKIKSLYPLYAEWNSKINVISRKDIEELYLHHVLHSLAIYKFIREYNLDVKSIIDVGTGGGFPGIPLAIAMPEVQFTLCDSVAKKIKVVADVVKELHLKNVNSVWRRSETLNEKFDYVVSRGVAELKNFILFTKNLYEKGIIYLKGGKVEKEIASCIKERKMSSELFYVKNILDWFEENFFAEKKVIFIRKDDKYF